MLRKTTPTKTKYKDLFPSACPCSPADLSLSAAVASAPIGYVVGAPSRAALRNIGTLATLAAASVAASTARGLSLW
jgi:hypothetical protein